MPGSLIDALGARSGIVCAVGAGGKKTILHRILADHPGRVGLTATVMSTFPDHGMVDARLTAEPSELRQRVPGSARHHRRVAFARPGHKPGRVAGLDPDLVAELHARSHFDVSLVKADGARMRGIKAPRADEPVVVPGCTTLISVVSAAVIGQALDERIAHRVERLGELLGIPAGTPITAAHIGGLISDEHGGRQRLGTARHIAVINQVDDGGRLMEARRAARIALDSATPPERVILASMTAADPIAEVIEPSPAGETAS